MSLNKCWELAQKWYTGRMDLNWQRPNPNELQKLFKDLELDGEFWNLG